MYVTFALENPSVNTNTHVTPTMRGINILLTCNKKEIQN